MRVETAQEDWQFKARRALRYVKLYGIARTWGKVKGRRHMNATATFDGSRWVNPACRTPESPDRTVAIIGCGNYAFSNIAYYLGKANPRFLRVAYDTERKRSLSLCRVYGGAYVSTDWRDILSDPLVTTVYIASNHSTHAEYAVACIEAGKHVHIEKPHVVSQDQLDRLLVAMREHPDVKVFLGFNRPKSRLFAELQRLLSTEPGPVMINWFITGHGLAEDHWYFDPKEGGRVLGNLSHWTDLTLHLVTLEKAFPCTIIPATPLGAKSDFVVAVNFADQSCAAITFSAKGHAFEGVREVLNVHKGDVLANLTDFHSLTCDVVGTKIRIRPRHRDHGHGANFINSMTGGKGGRGESQTYVEATGRFFLAIRQAVDSGEKVVLS